MPRRVEWPGPEPGVLRDRRRETARPRGRRPRASRRWGRGRSRRGPRAVRGELGLERRGVGDGMSGPPSPTRRGRAMSARPGSRSASRRRRAWTPGPGGRSTLPQAAARMSRATTPEGGGVVTHAATRRRTPSVPRRRTSAGTFGPSGRIPRGHQHKALDHLGMLSRQGATIQRPSRRGEPDPAEALRLHEGADRPDLHGNRVVGRRRPVDSRSREVRGVHVEAPSQGAISRPHSRRGVAGPSRGHQDERTPEPASSSGGGRLPPRPAHCGPLEPETGFAESLGDGPAACT